MSGHWPERPAPGARIIEIIGPAGAGKSTVVSRLCDDGVATSGSVWGLPRYHLALAGLRRLPLIARLWWRARRALGEDARYAIRLQALPRILAREGHPLTVLDEGPVFALAWLRVHGHRGAWDPETAWWNAAVRRCARQLDGIVWLDAPATTLAARIDSRDKWHAVKGQPLSSVENFVNRFRDAFTMVLENIRGAGGPDAIVLDTAAQGPAEIANLIRERWGIASGARHARAGTGGVPLPDPPPSSP